MNFLSPEKNRIYNFIIFITALSVLVLLSLKFTISNSPKKPHKNIVAKYIKVNKAHASLISVIPSLSPSPTYAPTPTASVSATPVPLGFCLNVPVLFYHHVQPEADAKAHKNESLTVSPQMFDTQMQYLTTHGYTTITAKQLVDALISHSQLPAKSIVVTMDDGYRDNFTYAFPVFQKYHLNANIMLATGLLEGSDYLTWGQVAEMKSSGLIYFTDHTWSHYSVNHGTNEKIQYEIQTAKQQIEQRTGQTTNIFTYPYGSVSSNTIALLRQDGFIGAFSTIPGRTQCDSFIMTLHRTRVGNAPLSQYGI